MTDLILFTLNAIVIYLISDWLVRGEADYLERIKD